MSRMIAVRLDEGLVASVDRERERLAISRARAIHDALLAWLERGRLEQAMRREHEGYERRPVSADEFGPVLGAQRWPK